MQYVLVTGTITSRLPWQLLAPVSFHLNHQQAVQSKSTCSNHPSNKHPAGAKHWTRSGPTLGLQRPLKHTLLHRVALGLSYEGHRPPRPEMLPVSPEAWRRGFQGGSRLGGCGMCKLWGWESMCSVLEIQLSSLDRTQVERTGLGGKCGQILEGRARGGLSPVGNGSSGNPWRTGVWHGRNRPL